MEPSPQIPAPREEFVCEEIEPVAGTGDASAMARGEPGLPARFVWRGEEYRLVGVIRQWKTSGPCRNGSEEMYLRRHWYQVSAACPPSAKPAGAVGGEADSSHRPHVVMTIYCDRQAKDRRRPKRRWWLYSMSAGKMP